MDGTSEKSWLPVTLIFLSSAQPTMALGPALPPVQWLPVACVGGVYLLTLTTAQINLLKPRGFFTFHQV